MKRANPAQLRESLETASTMVKHGISNSSAGPANINEIVPDLGKFVDWVWNLKSERDQLKAENEALRKALTDCADSLHTEMLHKFVGQLPDDMHPVTRREYDRDMAEVAGYLAAMGKGEQS